MLGGRHAHQKCLSAWEPADMQKGQKTQKEHKLHSPNRFFLVKDSNLCKLCTENAIK